MRQVNVVASRLAQGYLDRLRLKFLEFLRDNNWNVCVCVCVCTKHIHFRVKPKPHVLLVFNASVHRHEIRVFVSVQWRTLYAGAACLLMLKNFLKVVLLNFSRSHAILHRRTMGNPSSVNRPKMNRTFAEHMSIMTLFSHAKFTAKYFTLIY
jgi:hypothetical protein